MFSLSIQRSTFRVLLVAGVLLAGSILAMTMFNSTFAQDSGAIEYPENGTGPVAVFTAVDPEMKSVTWSVETDENASADIDGEDVADSALFGRWRLTRMPAPI